jgi:hypothetical protein
MDVSVKRSAAEFGANVIARSDDHATTRATSKNRLRNELKPSAQRVRADCAKSFHRLRNNPEASAQQFGNARATRREI